MSSTSVPKRKKPAYDPARQWGLKPADAVASGTPGATYVISGHVVGGSGTDLYVGENMGREGQAKAKRQNEKDSDRALKALLQRDKEGMKAVMKARQVAKEMDERDETDNRKSKKGKAKEKEKEKEKRKWKKDDVDLDEEDEEETNQAEVKSGKNAYSAQVIKQLGFDPTLKGGQRRVTDSAMQEKVCDYLFGQRCLTYFSPVGSPCCSSVLSKRDRSRSEAWSKNPLWCRRPGENIIRRVLTANHNPARYTLRSR